VYYFSQGECCEMSSINIVIFYSILDQNKIINRKRNRVIHNRHQRWEETGDVKVRCQTLVPDLCYGWHESRAAVRYRGSKLLFPARWQPGEWDSPWCETLVSPTPQTSVRLPRRSEWGPSHPSEETQLVWRSKVKSVCMCNDLNNYIRSI